MFLFVGYGILMVAVNISQFGAISLGVPVAIVYFLMNLQPIYTAIIGHLCFKEKINKIIVISLIIAIIGVVLILEPWKAKNINSWIGIILALIAGLLFSGWVLLGKLAGKKQIHPATTLFSIMLFALPFTLFAGLFLNQTIQEPVMTKLSFSFNLSGWFALGLMGIVCFIIGSFLFYASIRYITATDSGIIMMLDPVLGTIFAYFILNEILSLTIISGCVLVLISTYLIIKKK